VQSFRGSGSERDDLPSATLLGEIEKIPAAVIELAVYEEVKGRPDDGQIVVDADVRIVDAFFDVRGSGGHPHFSLATKRRTIHSGLLVIRPEFETEGILQCAACIPILAEDCCYRPTGSNLLSSVC
jgi:hypothetical protein